MTAYEVTQRGYDSSGRPLRNTAIKWQIFDRINEEMGGKLVIVQGAFMGSGGAAASAGTHNLAGCNDVRRWNLASAEASKVINLGNRFGEIWWERTVKQGFSPHFHNLLPNDYPLHPDARAQVEAFRRGENGLANRGPDTHARPTPFPVYLFEEDDMFEDSDRKKLDLILARLDKGFSSERERDKNERERDKKRYQSLVQLMGGQVDQLDVAINMLREDDSPSAKEVKRFLRKQRLLLLEQLSNDPDADDTPDKPSDEAVEEASSEL